MRKRVLFILMERYSDFNSMIERYEKEMRRIFEEKQRISFGEPSVRAAVFPEDAPQVPQYREKEQDYYNIPEEPLQPVSPPAEKQQKEETSRGKKGTITVEVSTARGAVPLSGVTVVIDRLDPNDPMGRKELIAVETTDQSGRTSPVMVEAEPRDSSLEPGNADPFTTFYVSAETKGFEPVKNRPVDVFADEISILQIELIPKPEKLAEGGVMQW